MIVLLGYKDEKYREELSTRKPRTKVSMAAAARVTEDAEKSSGEGRGEDTTPATAGSVAEDVPLSIQVQAMQNVKQSVEKRLKL